MQLEQSYIQLEILNAYKIKFSKNPGSLYDDIKDFDQMLTKFNFFRFFYTTGFYNISRA